MLRMWPAQARLDPRYQLDDDDRVLVDECFHELVYAAQSRTLDELLRGSPLAARADEATATVLGALRAGLRLRSRETEHRTCHGLDNLVASFVRTRDATVDELRDIPFDRATFVRHADELRGWLDGVAPATRGARWLHDIAALAQRAIDEPEPADIYREVVSRIEAGPRGRASIEPRRGHDFGDDKRAWDAWKAFDGDTRKQGRVRDGALRDDLLAPLRRWLAVRVARLRPVVLHICELVKARRCAVDQIDLLLRLRDLLRDDLRIRASCQAQLDHLFVDEFQDTDPLQAEIVLFLCERGACAATWDAVEVAAGKLTVVGDPKQSIYRFRRADIATYQQVVEILERTPHLAVQLTSSFRSAPNLVDWLNTRFDDILGRREPARASIATRARCFTPRSRMVARRVSRRVCTPSRCRRRRTPARPSIARSRRA